MKHRACNTRLYHTWTSMKARCKNPNNSMYKYYGGKGVKVCDEWKNDFITFRDWALTHGYADDLTIDRIDNDGNYEPSNCRWATILEQARNHTNNIRVMYKGKEYSPVELSKEMGVKVGVIYRAHKKGITDFTSFKPRSKAAVKNITFSDNHYIVVIKGKYIGRFKILDEAIAVRNETYKKFGISEQS